MKKIKPTQLTHEEHMARVKRAADEPVRDALRRIYNWQSHRRPPFEIARWESNKLAKPTPMECAPWLHRRIMQYKDKLPWCIVAWSVRRTVLPQHVEFAQIAGVSIERYMANLVKLEKAKREGQYREA